MFIKDFFILTIKLIGVFSLFISLFTVLPANISSIIIDPSAINITALFLIVIIVIGLFIVIFNNAGWIVDFLKLDQGFKNDLIEFDKFNDLYLAKLGVVIIGCLMFFENIPSFLNYTFLVVKSKILNEHFITFDNFNWLISGVSMFLGYIIVSNYKLIARFITKMS
ncbi:MAG: hypothetical protein HYZ16_02655 [Bacteroidetes bacterium]|nr:hypothetical protein [Bacteroidota bacterium]